jgi:hypothetical protein
MADSSICTFEHICNTILVGMPTLMGWEKRKRTEGGF